MEGLRVNRSQAGGGARDDLCKTRANVQDAHHSTWSGQDTENPILVFFSLLLLRVLIFKAFLFFLNCLLEQIILLDKTM